MLHYFKPYKILYYVEFYEFDKLQEIQGILGLMPLRNHNVNCNSKNVSKMSFSMVEGEGRAVVIGLKCFVFFPANET